jgi:fumarylacetoacetase
MTGFGIETLPYGAFRVGTEPPRIGVAIGDSILDLAPALGDDVFAQPTLNAFLARGRSAWTQTRERLLELVSHEVALHAAAPYLIPRQDVALCLPIEVADYVDFYSNEHHAINVGRMFRPDADPLPANWKHLPAGYHGRAGTVVVSGTPILRPVGQYRGPDGPVFGPEPRLDIEVELGFVLGTSTAPGTRCVPADLAEHVFGVVLLNDWSARAIQAWEYTPLGPFLGKSFATSISPWVVPLEALDAARVPAPAQDPTPLPYLQPAGHGFDIGFEVLLNDTPISAPAFRDQYWTPGQQLAHLTVGGAALRVGDLFASGTVSGPQREQRGSLLELSWNGAEAITLADGSTRTFLLDGDTVTIRATAAGPDGAPLHLGEVSGTIQPAR